MGECFVLGNQPTQFRVDLQNRLTQEDAAQLLVIILTACGFSTDAKIHHPVITGLFDEMSYDLGRQDCVDGFVDGGVDRDGMVFGQIYDIVIFEKHLVNSRSHQG